MARSLASKLKGQGPQTGIFTDGSCNPNPGPGGWGVVAVRDGKVLWSGRDHVPEATTNNRMELSAVIYALRKVGSTGRGWGRGIHDHLRTVQGSH